MNDIWNINLSAWVIQDGNYSDFEVGQETSFALELFPRKLEVSKNTKTSATALEAGWYSVCAETAFARPLVLDFGLLAGAGVLYPNDPLCHESGQMLEGEIALFLDSTHFVEELVTETSGMPSLTYTWMIEGISILAGAPYVRSIVNSQRCWVRDLSKATYKKIERTNAMYDDRGHAEYLLHCRKLEVP